MCTSIAFKNGNTYFGRNLDLDFPFHGEVVITPRHFPLNFKHLPKLKTHYAIIGMAVIKNNYPLYADASNEFGLSIAGLKFQGFAHYNKRKNKHTNIASFELIPYLLGNAKTCNEAIKLLKNANITNDDFDNNTPHSYLHWMIADKNEAYVIEQTINGLAIYHNPIGVMTNNPIFPYHLENIKNYFNITSELVESRFANNLKLVSTTSGAGTFSLPGDLSSSSRFVKVAFLRNNLKCEPKENDNVNNFFHVLENVSFVQGACKTENNIYEITQYSSCFSMDTLTYYYKTYHNFMINGVKLHKKEMVKNVLISYPCIENQIINTQN